MTGTFEGLGSLQFTPDNKYFYIYSGDITSVSSAATLLDFTNNSEYLIVKTLKMNITDQTVSGANYEFTVKFNGVTILIEFYTNPFASRESSAGDNYYLIIPPFTNVTIDFLTTSGDKQSCATICGNVGGAIEQENLESVTNNNKWAKL